MRIYDRSKELIVKFLDKDVDISLSDKCCAKGSLININVTMIHTFTFIFCSSTHTIKTM